MNGINWGSTEGQNDLFAAFGNGKTQNSKTAAPTGSSNQGTQNLGENFQIANTNHTFPLYENMSTNTSGSQFNTLYTINDSGANTSGAELNASAPQENIPSPPPANNWSMKNLFPELQIPGSSGALYSSNTGPVQFETLKKASRPTRKRIMKRLEELNGIVDSIESSLFFGMRGGMKGGGNSDPNPNEYWNKGWDKDASNEDPSPPNTAKTQQEANFEALFQKPQKYLRRITKRMRRIQRALDIIRR